ncbi:procathepsin L-like [Scomber japonicus]|uniref:procathepsin L-like n=1 Tax=Scomber japonicus TaxID=13676 RepID=UPI002305214C|nr:procathepsin L-like [Scomber japonicus]
MLLCVCMLLLVASDLGFCNNDTSLDDQWEQWKIKHGKQYYEEEYRRTIWEENKLKIEAHNKEAEQGKHSYRLGMNSLGDMTSKEMAEKMTSLGKHPSNHAESNGGKGQTTRFYYKKLGPPQCMKDFRDMATEEKVDNMSCPLKPPKSIDYRKRSMMTRVKDQEICGSCWAFSAAGALEGQLAKKTGQPLDLSTYPYTGKKQRCHHKRSANAAQSKVFKKVPQEDEYALAKALHEVGPVSVAIHASNLEFMLYKNGVYFNPECDKDNVDHAMLLVGYGETAEGQKYWIVENSFGESWGEEGYLRIARDCGNHCGIASDASYPLMREEI